MGITNCRLCNSSNTVDFLSLLPMPTQDGNMAASEAEALSIDKGNIDLVLCKNCGFIRNEGYDSNKVSFDKYDFSNDQSPLFRAYVHELTDRLMEQYHLQGKTIIDIGCGDGVFLQMLCEKGSNKGIGIDPGFDNSKRKHSAHIDIQYIQDYYSNEYAHLKPDFIACRLVIDLLDDPMQFVRMVRENLEDRINTVVYFEVPNAMHTLKDKIIWNIVYEHSVWYTVDSLRYQFECCGFEVLDVRTCWNDEFLGIEARPRPLPINKANLRTLSKTVEGFNLDYQKLLRKSQVRIDNIKSNKEKVLAWGAGARAVTFFNLFNVKKEIPYIIDINHKRHGKYIPGSGQKIVSPDFIVEYQPDLVIITNSTYAEEIKDHIHSLGLTPRYWIL